MELIKWINIITNTKVDKNFSKSNNDLLLERIKLASYMLVFTYPLFFIVDFFLLKDLNNSLFKMNLTLIHLIGLVSSILFILLYKYKVIQRQSRVIHIYISIYLLLGALSSINSQLLTGNVTSYVVCLFGVAAIFPIKPINLAFIISSIHIIFLVSLSFLEDNYINLLIKLINSTGAAVIAFVIAYVFYTYRKKDYQNQCRLKRNEEGFRSIFHMNPSPLILLNLKNNKIELLNQQAIEYYNLNDQNMDELDGSFIFKDKDEQDMLVNRLKENHSIENYITHRQLSSQLTRWALLNIELVNYLDRQCLLVGLTDVTNLKEKEEELLIHATIDMLTGVMNRRAGLELIQQQLQKQEEFIICFVDINQLKQVNDQYGHSEGDELIKVICETIRIQMDAKDVLFRFGGDEFILIFFGKKREEVWHFWKNIREEMERINHTNEKPYPLSVSHGLYHYNPEFPVSLEEMLEFADKEMYKEKVRYKKNECL
jgi:diguanylate cyclase (GGDEF)-like protein